MAKLHSPDLIEAQPRDVDRLASLSRAAKLSYRAWAPPGWQPPSVAIERGRWERRLLDEAGWTVIALSANTSVGTVHFTDSRTERGAGSLIEGRSHLSGLFVSPARWGEGIGSALLKGAVSEMKRRGYREAEACTAVANARSRTFYEARGWRSAKIDNHKHDDLSLATYERTVG